MKLITTSTELENQFADLIKRYETLYATVAWAGIGSKAFDSLCHHKDKIKRTVIGTHFYQTHPDFIATFLLHPEVKFIKQTSGVFHPKVYLFYTNEKDFTLLIGSANLTVAAFSINTEACVLINQKDEGAPSALKAALRLVNDSWVLGGYYNSQELEEYRTLWHRQKDKLGSLAGDYGSGNKKVTPFYRVPEANMSWRQYIELINTKDIHGINQRLDVLDTARKLFERNKPYSAFEDDERKFIAGTPNKLYPKETINAAFFGSMMGAGEFKKRINNNNLYISQALDHIPLSGPVTRAQYNEFIFAFREALSGKYIATTTRLLAMKRPDIFYCLTSQNQKRFCTAFGLVRGRIDYSRYWDDVVLRIQDCQWWANPTPASDQEKRIENARAAFMDAIYYEEKVHKPRKQKARNLRTK